jgi:Tol biopolymer transport system component
VEASFERILEPKRNVQTPLTTEPGDQATPIFSPDGQWVYYSATDEDGTWRGFYRRRRDGSGSEELVEDGPGPCDISSISSDGKHLLVVEIRELDIAVIHLGENGEKAAREPWLGGPSIQFAAEISPNVR